MEKRGRTVQNNKKPEHVSEWNVCVGRCSNLTVFVILGRAPPPVVGVLCAVGLLSNLN